MRNTRPQRRARLSSCVTKNRVAPRSAFKAKSRSATPARSAGPTATPMWLGPHGAAAQISAMTGADPRTIVAEAESEIPIGRFSTAGEVAAAIAFALRRQGKWEQSLEQLQKAAQRDPQNLGYRFSMAENYAALRRWAHRFYPGEDAAPNDYGYLPDGEPDPAAASAC